MATSSIEFLRPTYKIEFVKKNAFVSEETNRKPFLIDLKTSSRMARPLNVATLTIRTDSKNPFTIGTAIKIYLGYYKKDVMKNAVALVYTGIVDTINTELDETTIGCVSCARNLLTTRRNLVYNRNTIDKIIEKLVEEGNVAVSKIDPCSITKEVTILSANCSLYDYVRALAEEANFDVYMDIKDEFVASQPSQASFVEEPLEALYEKINRGCSNGLMHKFKFGVNVINTAFVSQEGDVGSVISTDFTKYSEETSYKTIEPLVSEAAVSGAGNKFFMTLPHTTKKDADKITKNILLRRQKRVKGEIKVIGAPQVRLGDTIMLEGNEVFSSQQEKVFKVVGVSHSFNIEEGFYTSIEVEEYIH